MAEVDKQSESKLDAERELARKLLQRCSDLKTSSGIYGKKLSFMCIILYLLTTNEYIL